MLKLDCQKETDRIVEWIQATFVAKGFEKVVIGISGGLDSAVVATLLVKALGQDSVMGYLLPYGVQTDIADSKSVIRNLDIQCSEVNIRPIIDAFEGTDISNLRLGNLQARTRMMILYDASVIHNALVAGTGNKTELDLGYFTLHGDGACALEPIGHLYKTEVRQLAEYLEVPERIIEKAPSAGLWEGQTDEEELGGNYEEIDEILMEFEIFDKNHHYVACSKLMETLGAFNKDSLYFKLMELKNKNKFKTELPKMIER